MVIRFYCIIDSYLYTMTYMTTLTSAKRAQLVIQAKQPFFGWKMLFSCILQLSELIQMPQKWRPRRLGVNQSSCLQLHEEPRPPNFPRDCHTWSIISRYLPTTPFDEIPKESAAHSSICFWHPSLFKTLYNGYILIVMIYTI
jgi:hypothetical protein